MIDYAILCQAIGDWRAGRRPTLPPSSTPTLPAARVEAPSMEEVDSDLLVVDEFGEPAAPDDYQAPDHTPIASEPYDATRVYGRGYEEPE